MCLGIPGQIISINPADPLLLPAQVSFGGITKEVALCFTPEAKVGQYVIVHVGFAISVINEAQAQALIQAIDQLGDPEHEISN